MVSMTDNINDGRGTIAFLKTDCNCKNSVVKGDQNFASVKGRDGYEE